MKLTLFLALGFLAGEITVSQAAPVLIEARAVEQRTELSLSTGCQAYIYGFATGGGYDSSAFSNGSQQLLKNANGRITAGLAITTSNRNDYQTQTEWHSIGGFGVSGSQYVQALYGQSSSPGALSASVKFSLQGRALVVAMALGGGHQYLELHGPGQLAQEASTAQGNAKPIIIGRAELGPGQYEISESTSSLRAQAEAGAGQDPNNMADLLGVFIFSDQPTGLVSDNPQMPVPQEVVVVPTPPTPAPESQPENKTLRVAPGTALEVAQPSPGIAEPAPQKPISPSEGSPPDGSCESRSAYIVFGVAILVFAGLATVVVKMVIPRGGGSWHMD